MGDRGSFWVSNHFRRVTTTNPKWTIQCAYCLGKGVDPVPAVEKEDCPVCGGSGLLECDVNPSGLKVCPCCKGGARRVVVWQGVTSCGRPNVYGVLRPCFDCGGSGMV